MAHPDIFINNQGSVVQFFVRTKAARAWVEQNLQLEGWQWLGKRSFAIDWRYVDRIVEGMEADGLVVS